jgi:hypothetical protein
MALNPAPKPPPEDAEVLYGLREIAHYLRMHPATVKVWRIKHGLPIAVGPNGYYMTTKTAIARWIEACNITDLQQSASQKPRG